MEQTNSRGQLERSLVSLPQMGKPSTRLLWGFYSVQSLSHIQLLATPWDCSTQGFPAHHQLPESTETHVHWVGDAIQPSHPLSFPSPPAFNLSQHQFSSVQSLSRVRVFETPWIAVHQASLSITNSQSLPKSMSIESVMASNKLILCHPLHLLPLIFPSIRVFSNKSALCIWWPKCEL